MDIIEKFNSDLLSNSRAIYSIDLKYRYLLERIWDETKPLIAYCLLNPSTATELSNDPTIERCETRSILWKFGGYIILNAFAFRSTDPNGLLWVEDPVGPENDFIIMENAQRASTFICGWGTKGILFDRGRKLQNKLREANFILHALKINEDGSPAHPLYLPYSKELMEY